MGVTFLLAACGGKGGNGTDAETEPEAALDAADAVHEPECSLDDECADTLYCNGVERCLEGVCMDGDPVVCDDEDVCTEDSCSEDEERCEYEPLDADEDGYAAETGVGGIPCGGTDCDDSDPDVNPGARLDCLAAPDVNMNCNDIPDWEEVVLTPVGTDVRVTDHIQDTTQPVIAWSGSEYGAAWTDDRHGGSEIYFTRLDTAGTIVGSELRVTDATDSSAVPRISWTGSQYGIAWHRGVIADTEIYFARVGADGAMIGTELRVTTAVRLSSYADIAWTGSAWGLVWQDSRRPLGGEDVYFQHVGGDGALVGGNVQVIRLNAALSFPRMTWSGSEFAIAWADNPEGNFEVYFARLDGTGSMVGSELRLTSAAENSGTASIVWTGSEYAIAWVDARDGNNEIYLARVSASGTKLTSDIRITDFLLSSDSPYLEWTGRDFGLAFADHRDETQIWFVRIAVDGTMRNDEVKITTDPATSLLPCLAWNGSEFGLTWGDFRHDPLRAQVYFNALECP
ncbi:MAG: hypothetical protein JRG91_15845 [Deltaproteobacteria bacterium]|nr:hypothetical protein [Deltaproteobacteria bacterium]